MNIFFNFSINIIKKNKKTYQSYNYDLINKNKLMNNIDIIFLILDQINWLFKKTRFYSIFEVIKNLRGKHFAIFCWCTGATYERDFKSRFLHEFCDFWLFWRTSEPQNRCSRVHGNTIFEKSPFSFSDLLLERFLVILPPFFYPKNHQKRCRKRSQKTERKKRGPKVEFSDFSWF